MRSVKPYHKNTAPLIFLVIIIQLTIIDIFALYFNIASFFYCSVPFIAAALGMQYFLNDRGSENTKGAEDN
ncbi:MAG: hypothetical protein JNJ41_02605 [Bacteroidia bacterium]|nr:hypothetical protein [Bacteroidia bacterium]